MASSHLLTTASSSIETSFFPKTTKSTSSINKKLIKKPYYYSAPNKLVSCKVTSKQNPSPNNSNNNGDSSLNKFDRRDVLIGLGGLYGTTNLVGGDLSAASAAPIEAPDLSKCGEATVSFSTEKVLCCPPVPTTLKIIDFKPPEVSRLRYRPAAHLVNDDYLAKYKRALELMKKLDPNDPRRFKQQANVHCAYCNGAYEQVGFPDLDIQVHFNWLFFPFHRLYLYFFERILGEMIGDADFAMPYWNWDSPAGMAIPAIYTDPRSPLYDCLRNIDHLPPKLADLNYGGNESGLPNNEQINRNLCIMHQQVVRQKFPSLFFGGPYRASQAAPTNQDKPPTDPREIKGAFAGSVEAGSHTALHIWVGDPRQDNNEDMGNFYSAGRDPLFYAHHCNIDRIWNIWKNFPGPKRRDINDPDYLNSSFLFYDEKQNLVRCKVSDCLDSKALGYDYQLVDTPWIHSKQVPHGFRPGGPPGRPGGPGGPPRRPGGPPGRPGGGPPGRPGGPPGRPGPGPRGQARAAEITTEVLEDAFPLVLLDKIVRVEIPRPRTSRSKFEKEEEEEVLVIENIKIDGSQNIKFDVYIDDVDDEVPSGPQDSEFAGTFTNIPHGNHSGMKMKTNLVVGISELLEDLDVEGDESIVVTLVPSKGSGPVTIEGIRIDFITE